LLDAFAKQSKTAEKAGGRQEEQASTTMAKSE
jgi:hypothetical protein